MTSPGALPLRTARVLRTEPDGCLVSAGNHAEKVGYAAPFAPRASSVAPGHLVALAATATGSLVVWRWFDAVVVEQDGAQVRLWEAAHGEVTATARFPERVPAAGRRAYASAGLPGADWWVEGEEVALDEVRDFYAAHGLWGQVLSG